MWVIEFRSGSFFIDLTADNGGTMAQAMRFQSQAEVDEYMHDHEWIRAAGGMAVPAR
jgi:hypothetical protein